MLLRLILGLLIAMLALPAMARSGCHDDRPATTAAAHHAMSMPVPAGKHDGTATDHLCAGCIPPSTWRSGVVTRATLPAALPIAARIATLDFGAPAPPATPPPRRTA